MTRRDKAAGPASGDGPIRILVSACLLGERVRYDGGHKRDDFIADTLGRLVECVPVCPEVECGLPTPREAMRLAGDVASPCLVTVSTCADHTARMVAWAHGKLRELERLELSGYICKEGSPSCGLDGVEVSGGAGAPVKTCPGVFTGLFLERFPLLPVVDEDRLKDPAPRDRFLETVLGRRRSGLTGKAPGSASPGRRARSRS
ncbi:MAG: DUF523 domain-containing protein [Deltaproteobacteria bacterium]|nr:DUF523 domain-containing protein [Deltaproteobacteria bacterium]